MKTLPWPHLALLGILAGMLAGCSTRSIETLQPSAAGTAEPVAPLPTFVLSPTWDFTLAGVDGQAIRLAAWRGQSPLVLSFFATDCHGCAEELPHLVRLYGAFASQGLKLVMVSPEPLQRIQEYALARRLTFPVLSDPQGALHRAYGASGTPDTLLIDRDGKVVQALGALTAVTHFEDQLVPRVVRELRRSTHPGRG